MEYFNKEHAAIVLGLSMCGLGVIRSLGVKGVRVYGFDYRKEGGDGFYSKYVKADICPHPAYQPEQLIEFFSKNFAKESKKPILFPTCDEFVKFISDQRAKLEKYFLFNISSREIIDSIIDKKIQYELAKKTTVPISDTYYPESIDDVYNIREGLKYPVIIKGRYSFKWREELGGTFKGFKVGGGDELVERCTEVFNKRLPIIIQRVIIGPNTNHFKLCVYINKEGKILAKFTLRKIRQYPIDFGVGTSVESIEYKELEETGIKFFNGIGYKGVGSAEFKLDLEDNRLKLIELNPRYWMQNEQAAYCGINFAIAQYLDLSGQEVTPNNKFLYGIKWIDPLQDFKSFFERNPYKISSIFYWVNFLITCKVFSMFSWQDLKPFLKSINFGLKVVKLPRFLINSRKTTKENG